jgi:hypothetical protein
MKGPRHYVSHGATLFFQCYSAALANAPLSKRQPSRESGMPQTWTDPTPRTTDVGKVTCAVCLKELARVIRERSR